MPTIGRSDLDIFPLVLGTNTFGWTADTDAAFEVLDAFTAAGGSMVDSADGYSRWVPGNSGGESETIIGQWMASHGARDRVVVATKVSTHPDFKGLAAANVKAAAEASLGRLQTDRIDLYYAHWDDAEAPLEETAAAFDELVREGKVRWIAVSNYSADRIEQWMRIAEENGLAKPVAVQPHYNLLARQPFESEIAPVAEKHGLSVLPYYGLAAGMLTGKYRKAEDLEGADRAAQAGRYLSDSTFGVIDTLVNTAESLGVAPATVALAWLRSRPTVAAPIASARHTGQLDALIAAAELDLPADAIARLDAVSA